MHTNFKETFQHFKSAIILATFMNTNLADKNILSISAAELTDSTASVEVTGVLPDNKKK